MARMRVRLSRSGAGWFRRTSEGNSVSSSHSAMIVSNVSLWILFTMVNNLYKNCLLVNSIFFLTQKWGSREGRFWDRLMTCRRSCRACLKSISDLSTFSPRYSLNLGRQFVTPNSWDIRMRYESRSEFYTALMAIAAFSKLYPPRHMMGSSVQLTWCLKVGWANNEE